MRKIMDSLVTKVLAATVILGLSGACAKKVPFSPVRAIPTPTPIPTQTPTPAPLTLDQYPFPFMDGCNQDMYLIVGANGTVNDVIAAVEIGAGMRQGCGGKPPLGTSKLDTEFATFPPDKDFASIGIACNNGISAQLLGLAGNCAAEIYNPGEAMITLRKESNGKHSLLVTGYDPIAIRTAAAVLANYQDYPLAGTEILVTGTPINPSIQILK